MKIIVPGRPASIQSSSTKKQTWKNKVSAAANAKGFAPLVGDDIRISITHFYKVLPDFDTDNTSKPICDALNGIAYADDHQLSTRNARRRKIEGSYQLENPDPDLVAALTAGEDFVYIEIDRDEEGL